ncbi:MAG: DNA topoisomerase [Lachnospiraceae bacterium]|nr:DNA topoisomerase [Lachnospiraceae bacterium]
MGKFLYIAEKPSVAQEFAKALKISGSRKDGYIESDDAVVTWCVGHLVTMSYPAAYDEKYRRWSLDTLPFLPKEWKYEVIDSVRKQYGVVSRLLKREDVSRIYVCTDSGREGEYIYRLVEQMAGVKGKERRRVWIDSQTEEEILRGIREAKDLSEYDNLSNAAYLRAKEDYLMGINFSRLLTLRYGSAISDFQHMEKRTVISVGRVMTCVLGMVVRREREIRSFVKMPFYRVLLTQTLDEKPFDAEWRAVEGSACYQSSLLYKENGFKRKEDAEALCAKLKAAEPQLAEVIKIERKKEQKYAPLLFNLAELQNECSRRFHISPDETLKITQELYEKKLVTYPRTDARVLSSAVAKEIYKNIGGLRNYAPAAGFAAGILEKKSWQGIAKSRYVNDKQITDHYAIVPTGQGLTALARVAPAGQQVYDLIVRRFLSIFYPPAVYQKAALVTKLGGEQFFANFRILMEEGYLAIAPNTFEKKKKDDESEETGGDAQMLDALMKLRKGALLPVKDVKIREGETTPPKRYNSGSMILAMENAGQLIEDEELRAQIKGSGIGTSATRAEILNKLVKNKYIALNKKTQIITPTLLGENIFDVVNVSIRSLLNPELTASWEKGLTYVAEGQITPEEYMGKLESFVSRHTRQVKESRQHTAMRPYFEAVAVYYKKENSRRKT